MSTNQLKKMVEVDFERHACDFCNHYVEYGPNHDHFNSSGETLIWGESQPIFIDKCAICENDFCNDHKGVEYSEDGSICHKCAETYQFDISGVSFINIKTGEKAGSFNL